MYNYAQIDGSGLVVCVSQLKAKVDKPQLIEISGDDGALIGKRWNGSEFVEVAQAEQPRGPLSRLDFMNLFSDSEMAAIYEAEAGSTLIKVWVKKLEAASQIDLSDQRTIDGINALESAGLIGAGRAAEILGQ